MSADNKKRAVFFISDRTGKTAESIGESLLSQFDGFEFEYKIFSFVTTKAEALMVASEIQQQTLSTKKESLVFSTLVDIELQDIVAATDACVISLFNSFIAPLEASLNAGSSCSIGKTHEEYDDKDYKKHMDAIDFTLNNDDGIRLDLFDEADIILIGVSRSAKTPSCLYLAMNFSIKAANYPLTDDDLEKDALPAFLLPHTHKIVGLTIRPDQLSAIRTQRRPGTLYASLKKCREEIKKADMIMHHHGLFVLDSTAMSIEEIAVKIVKDKALLQHT